MNAKELREKSVEELNKELLAFANANGLICACKKQWDRCLRLTYSKKLRHNISRIKTILEEKRV